MSLKLRKKDLVEKSFVVNGKSFDVYFSSKDANLDVVNNHTFFNDVYKKPSETKRELCLEWTYWFLCVTEDLENDYICINSYNNYNFTLKGCITFNKIQYYFYISQSKQLLFLV